MTGGTLGHEQEEIGGFQGQPREKLTSQGRMARRLAESYRGHHHGPASRPRAERDALAPHSSSLFSSGISTDRISSLGSGPGLIRICTECSLGPASSSASPVGSRGAAGGGEPGAGGSGGSGGARGSSWSEVAWLASPLVSSELLAWNPERVTHEAENVQGVLDTSLFPLSDPQGGEWRSAEEGQLDPSGWGRLGLHQDYVVETGEV